MSRPTVHECRILYGFAPARRRAGIGNAAAASSATLEFGPQPEIQVDIEAWAASDQRFTAVIDHFPDAHVTKRYDIECAASADGRFDLVPTAHVPSRP